LDEAVDGALILRLLPAFLISFCIVMYMLISYYSPSLAGLIGMVVALFLGLFQGRDRLRLRDLAPAFKDALGMAAVLSLLLIAIGPLGQAFLTTNLANRLGTVAILMLPDSQIVMLLGAALLALVLGLGLPTPVAYIVTALALVPFLQQLGVAALMAHFFVFYFAVYSALTPPVAVASLAAAKIADADLNETTWESQKLMLTTFVIPFAFVYHPSLMSFPNLTWEVLVPVVTCLLLQWTVAITCYGYFLRDQTRVERWLWGIVSCLGYAALCGGGVTTNIAFGLVMFSMTIYVYLTRENGPRIGRQPFLERKTVRPIEAEPPPAMPTQGRFE
jgi:TRAP-type uncharacterized transport system fused permease subunit